MSAKFCIIQLLFEICRELKTANMTNTLFTSADSYGSEFKIIFKQNRAPQFLLQYAKKDGKKVCFKFDKMQLIRLLTFIYDSFTSKENESVGRLLVADQIARAEFIKQQELHKTSKKYGGITTITSTISQQLLNEFQNNENLYRDFSEFQIRMTVHDSGKVTNHEIVLTVIRWLNGHPTRTQLTVGENSIWELANSMYSIYEAIERLESTPPLPIADNSEDLDRQTNPDLFAQLVVNIIQKAILARAKAYCAGCCYAMQDVKWHMSDCLMQEPVKLISYHFPVLFDFNLLKQEEIATKLASEVPEPLPADFVRRNFEAMTTAKDIVEFQIKVLQNLLKDVWQMQTLLNQQ